MAWRKSTGNLHDAVEGREDSGPPFVVEGYRVLHIILGLNRLAPPIRK